MNTQDDWKDYPVSKQINIFIQYMMQSQMKGNTFEHLIIMKTIDIRDEIFDQEYIRHNMERYKNGEDRSNT